MSRARRPKVSERNKLRAELATAIRSVDVLTAALGAVLGVRVR